MNIIILDTETANSMADENGKQDLTQSLAYDCGYIVVNTDTWQILCMRSFVIADIFIDYKDMMQSAYYAQKIPKYWEDIKNGTRRLTTLETFRKILLDDMLFYMVKVVCAHNASFDNRATNNTVRYLTKSKDRWLFPYGTEIWDSLKMARDTFGKDENYIAFCEEHDFMTKHKTPRARLTAEIIYRYITQNLEFEESHTGLEDVLIELEIVKACMNYGNPEMRYKLWED